MYGRNPLLANSSLSHFNHISYEYNNNIFPLYRHPPKGGPKSLQLVTSWLYPQALMQEKSSTSGRDLMTSVMPSMDEDDLTGDQQQCLLALREGKRLLKQQHGASAMVRFEKALMLAKSLGEKIYERRATRGLAAAARLQVIFFLKFPVVQRQTAI